MTRPLLPVDVLTAAYNAVLAVLWTALRDRAPYALWIGAAHAAAAAMPWLLIRVRAPSRVTAVLREFYPLIMLAGFWSELGLLRDVWHAGSRDLLVAGLDRALFGSHLHLAWMPAMPWPWFSEAMHLAYFAYYALIVVPPVMLLRAGRTAALRDFIFRLLAVYVACYVVYHLVPVDGPRHTMPGYDGPLVEGLFYRLVHASLDAGDSMGTAFPSSHVAGAVMIALSARGWGMPRAAFLLSLHAAAVALATVYTQNHYAVDALAGLVVAVAVHGAVMPVLTRWLARPARFRPVPA